MLTGWSALLLAGLLEIVWAVGLKYSDSFTKFWPMAIMVTAIALSFWLLTVSLKSVPFGTAYAVWTGIGAAGGMIIGVVALWRLRCCALAVCGYGKGDRWILVPPPNPW